MRTIAILINRLRNGGAQKATVSMCNHLIKEGYKIVIFTVKNEEISFKLDNNIKIIIPNILLTPKTAYEYFSQKKEEYDIDILITPMHFDITYLRLLPEIERTGIRTIAFEHASYLYPLLLRQNHVYFVEKLNIYKKISCLCCVGIKDFLFWSSLGVKKIYQLDNIIEEKESCHCNLHSKTILFVGRLQQDKNIFFIIDNLKELLAQHEEWRLVLVGTGNQERYIYKYIHDQELQDKIILAGYTDTPEEYYKDASMFVLASQNETFSYALYEAKTYGIPAVIPDMPFNALAMQTKGHLVFKTAEEFRAAAAMLMEQEGLREKLSKEALETITHAFTWRSLRDKYLRLFEAVAKKDISFFKNYPPINSINIEQLNNIFLEIYTTLSSHLKNCYITVDNNLKKYSRYSLNFDNNYPIGTTRRKIAVFLLYMVKKAAQTYLITRGKTFSIFGSISAYYYNKAEKKGIFCVDWNTMPEIKDNLFDEISCEKYYVQSKQKGKIDIITKHKIKTSKLIITSSETRWLRKAYNGQKRMFINHACGAFKRTGFFMDKDYLKKYGDYDYLITSSKNITGILSEAFQTKIENIYPLGIPRTDRCFNTELKKKAQERFFTFYPNFIGKKIYIFAPTFRKTDSGYVNMFNLNFEDVATKLNNDERIIISLHPHIQGKIKTMEINEVTNIITNNKNIFFANNQFSTFDLSIVADTVITDYSSIIFEAMLMDKKIGFYSEDYEKYDRGIYFDYLTEGPSTVLTDSDPSSFVDYIRNLSANTDAYKRFKDTHVGSCDGQSTRRVLALISDIINS